MQLTQRPSDLPADRLLQVSWKILAGLVLAIGLIFLGTVVVESTLPQLPDQARAGIAMRPSGIGLGGVIERAGEPAPVEHFHSQFMLKPGTDSQGHVEAF
jgi:hypothetical protein